MRKTRKQLSQLVELFVGASAAAADAVFSREREPPIVCTIPETREHFVRIYL